MKLKSKHIFGPGGARCACCRIGSQSAAKRGDARAQRRKAKMALRCE